MAEAGRSLGRDLAPREASGELAGRGLEVRRTAGRGRLGGSGESGGGFGDGCEGEGTGGGGQLVFNVEAHDLTFLWSTSKSV